MHDKEQGYILQSFSLQNQRFSILTRTRGRLTVSLKKPQRYALFRPGMLIAFVLNGEHFLTIDEVELISVPFISSKRNIDWIHHWIELCFYSSQPELPCLELFTSLSLYFKLIKHDIVMHDDRLKLLCVLHFFYQTGFYAHGLFMAYRSQLAIMNYILNYHDFGEILNDLEQSVNRLSIEEIKQIEFLVKQFLHEHPSFRLFKTMRFVYPDLRIKG